MIFKTPEFKVGGLIVVVLALVSFMSMKVSEGPGFFTKSNIYWFEIDNASGLVKNSSIKMAGINVGVIDDIKLIGGNARIFLKVKGSVPVNRSTRVELKSDGILGDKHVSIETEDLALPLMKKGQLPTNITSGGMDEVMSQVGKIADSLSGVAEVIERAATNGDPSTTLGRILSNVEAVTANLAQISGDNGNRINDIIGRMDSMTSTLNRLMIDTSDNGFASSWGQAMNGLRSFDSSLSDVSEIANRINNGEGTIGRLINDEETVEGLNQAIGNFNSFVGGAKNLEFAFDYRSEALFDRDLLKSHLNVRIKPGLDRYYLLGVTSDEFGSLRQTETVTTVDGGAPTTVVQNRSDRDRLRINAQYNRNIYNWTIRAGIFENEPGAGLDYTFFDRLRLSVEGYNYEDFNLRAFVRYEVAKGLYFMAGGDSLTDNDLRTGFVGGGIYITNDDLSTLGSLLSFK